MKNFITNIRKQTEIQQKTEKGLDKKEDKSTMKGQDKEEPQKDTFFKADAFRHYF